MSRFKETLFGLTCALCHNTLSAATAVFTFRRWSLLRFTAQMPRSSLLPSSAAHSPKNFSRLITATSTDTGEISIAYTTRPHCSPAVICDPEPQKGSKQISPETVCFRIGIAKSSTGFWVGCSLPRTRALPSQSGCQTPVRRNRGTQNTDRKEHEPLHGRSHEFSGTKLSGA